MTALENILGSVQNKAGEIVDLVKHFSGKTVIIYVGLNSDEDCKIYNPILVEYYNKNHELKNFDVVFASWSPIQADIDEAYEDMPWLVLPINSLKNKMGHIVNEFEVYFLPTLIFLNADTGELYEKRNSFIDLLSNANKDKVKFIFSSKTVACINGSTVNQNGEIINLKKHLNDKTAALYFASDSCELNKTVLSVLVDYYNKHHENKKFEIIFISSDKDENDFQTLYKQMPWLALSYNERDIEEELNKKFNINSTSLVFFDSDTDKLSNRTKDFQDLIDVFPSYPAEIIFEETEAKVYDNKMEELLGGIVINHKNEKIDIKKDFSGKTIGLYFCRSSDDDENLLSVFTEYYKSYHEAKNFEVVFVSFEDDKSNFDTYFNRMPWLAIPFNKKKLSIEIYRKYAIYPGLVFLNGDTSEVSDCRRKFRDLMSLIKTDELKATIKLSNTIEAILDGSVINEKNETIDSKKQLTGKTLGIYYAAESCEKSKTITPILANYYKNHREAKNFEIVYVSKDLDGETYYKQMPWFFLREQAEKDEICEKFHVGETPSLIFVNYDKDEISDRRDEFKDLVEVFPSYPAEIIFNNAYENKMEQLFDGVVINHKNEKIEIKTQFCGKTIGIYFSAHWCGPCRGFTPVLSEFYKNHHESKNFEIVFASSDSDLSSFKTYYEEMPWLSLPFNKQNIVRGLKKKYNIQGIPTLVLIDADNGELLQSDARTPIQFKKELIDEFPWKGVKFSDDD